MKKITSLLLVFAMVLALFGGSVAAVPATAVDEAALEEQLRQALFSAEDRQYAEDAPEPETYDPDEVIRVIVEMQAAPGYETMSVSGASPASAEAQALKGQEATIATVRWNLGLEPVHRSGYLVNTVSYDIRRGDIEKLEQMPSVISVSEAVRYTVEMNSAKEIAHVYEAWNMSEDGVTGQGMVIAIIDSGVNWLHPDMENPVEHPRYTQTEMEEKITELGYGKWFSEKVPFGHCYVSGYDEITNNMNFHGYHVAGIAAANGADPEGSVQGVAPDAQILALQVWDGKTNQGGYSDDIICAIEDAVKLGADVINLSLGIEAGFYGNDQYMSHAVNKAEEAGVFVSVAAGNAGISSDDNTKDSTISNSWSVTDTATISDPAIAFGATAVASVDSHGFVGYRLTITPQDGEAVEYVGLPLCRRDFVRWQSSFLLDCGSGQDYELDKENAEGNIALVHVVPQADWEAMMDEIYPIVRYADMYGYAGVIFYHGEEGGGLDSSISELYGRMYDKIPSVFVSNADGAKLLSLCAEGKQVTVSDYLGTVFMSVNMPENYASCFTSWGATHTLDLKPELAAPGGKVISLGDKRFYTIMSGTSMAAPFVAGSAALVKQNLLEAGFEVEDIPDFIRTTLMNTASPVVQGTQGNMASVRQVGAGLVNVANAMENTVLATFEGKASIALYDKLEKETTGEILLTNYGTEAVTYKLCATNVYTDFTDPITKAYSIQVLENAIISFDQPTVTVPANGTATVSFRLRLDRLKDGHFVEGYVQLLSETSPNLSLPFLGFMGDWDAETIIDVPEWERHTIIPQMDYGYYGFTSHGTSLITIAEGAGQTLGEVIYSIEDKSIPVAYSDPERIAISPDGDGYFDVVIPCLGLLRNASEIRYDILDETGAVIASPGSAFEVSKLVGCADINSYSHSKPLQNANGGALFWDGLQYNQSTGQYDVVPEGNYTVRLQARVREDGQWQTVTMPVRVDLTPPEITYFEAKRTAPTKVEVSFRFSEENFIRNSFVLNINGESFGWDVAWFDYDEATGTYTYTEDWYAGKSIPMDETVVCAMMIADDAGNHAFKMVTANVGTQSVGLTNLSLETVNFTSEPTYDVYGYAPEGSTATFNGTAAEFDGNNFHVCLDLLEEVNHFTVEICDAQGQSLLSGNAIVHSCSTSANFGTPLLDSEFPATLGGTCVEDSYTGLKFNNYIYILDQDYEDGTELPLRIKIADPACVQVILKNKATGEEENLSINEEGYAAFTMKLESNRSDYLLTVKAPTDNKKTNITIWNHTAGEDALRWERLDYTVGYWNLQNLFTYVHPSMLQEDGSFRISGYIFNPLQKITICGKDAVINLDTMEWYCDIPLKMGINTIPIYCYSDSGYCYDTPVKKVVLSDGPSLNLDLPDLDQDGKYYVQDASFLLQGTVITELDDATVYINDSQVYGSNNCGHLYGGELAVREFSKELTLEHGDNYITVYASDNAGFSVTQQLDLYYCPSHRMKDLQEGSWYHEVVDYVLERNLMLGIGNDIFSPNGVATRGQLITVLYRLSGETVDTNAPNPFVDVSEEQYYANAIRWGYVKGIVKGISAERFAPEMPISREQAATFLYRYVTLILKQEPAKGADLGVFTDGGKVHDYAKEAMAWAVAAGYFQGYGDGTLLPVDNLTRAQMAKLLTILDRDS